MTEQIIPGPEDFQYLEKIREELRTVREQVLWTLERYESARNDDLLLTWIVLRTFHGLKMPYVEWQELKSLPKLESIRRVRQKLQNEDGTFPPTDPTVLARRRREWAMKTWATASE